MKQDLHLQSSLSTNRLHLDLLTLEDHDFIFALVNSRGWIKYIGDRNIHSTEDAVAYIHKILNSENIFYWVAREKDTHTPLGVVTFIKRNYLDNFDIGFAFLPAYNGHGYAYEAAKAVLAMAEKNPVFTPMLATTIPSNESSIKLLTKLGLHFEKEITVEKERLHVYTNAAF